MVKQKKSNKEENHLNHEIKVMIEKIAKPRDREQSNLMAIIGLISLFTMFYGIYNNSWIKVIGGFLILFILSLED